jgi:hypothetical protein
MDDSADEGFPIVQFWEITREGNTLKLARNGRIQTLVKRSAALCNGLLFLSCEAVPACELAAIDSIVCDDAGACIERTEMVCRARAQTVAPQWSPNELGGP